MAQLANRYVIASNDISGTVDTTSISNSPVVDISVDNVRVKWSEVRESTIGIEVTAAIERISDVRSKYLQIILPRVYVADSPVPFVGVAIFSKVNTYSSSTATIDVGTDSYAIH